MTPAQEQAIEQVRLILKGHFDSWLLSYRITDETLRTKINHDWHGDITSVCGLASITNARLMDIISIRAPQQDE